MKTLVLARYNENISWSSKYDHVHIVQKERDLPNKGRESSSYIWWVIQNYEKLPEKVHFLQGNPFAHTNDNLESTYFPETDRNGCALHCGLKFEEITIPLGIELPERWSFPAGANFEVTKSEILKYKYDWYKKAYNLSINHEQAPWIFERLWCLIYKL